MTAGTTRDGEPTILAERFDAFLFDLSHPMLSGSVVSQIWQAAANHGYGPKGHTSIYDFIERFYTGEES